LPSVSVFARADVPAKELDDDSITHQIPVCSLPQILGWPIELKPYILPDENLRKQLREKYKAGRDDLLVGISWRSGNSQEGAKRSINLELWESIFKIPGVKFVSLQYGQCEKQIQQTNERFGIEIIYDRSVNPLTDLESFCAQTAAMDVVISVDNSTVHFAALWAGRSGQCCGRFGLAMGLDWRKDLLVSVDEIVQAVSPRRLAARDCENRRRIKN
jgi:hypothetical protein